MPPDDTTRGLTRSASTALADTLPPEGKIARAGRLGAGIVGVATTGFSLLALLGFILNHAKDPLSTSIVGSVIVGLFAVGGAALARWGLPPRRRAPGPAPLPPRGTAVPFAAIRKHMLAVASQYRGRLTAAELAAALDLEEAPAARALEAAAEAGEARMLFSPEGVAVFEFAGLVADKAGAKEPWDL